jgi:serine/threonine-protein kinase
MKICPKCKTEYPGGEAFCPLDGARLVSASSMHVAAAAGVAVDPLVGSVLGERYKILRRIGEGGMGIVYEAMHVVIEKHVALKVLREDFSSRPEVVERFRQEAKSASRIGHPNIVDISDFGETPDGLSYFVMEMLEGEDLANVLARERTLPPARAVAIALQCCKALGAAHAKGIVHRDMKPENIFLVRRDGEADFVKIVDFGIAKMSDIETAGAPGRKLTKTGMIFGTPEYMSPEQAAGKADLDHRVDIYALGVILFEMLTGRVPFVGDTFMGVLTQHMFEPVPDMHEVNPQVQAPGALPLVVRKALAKDPDERYRTMEEFGRALAGAMDMSAGFPVEAGTGVTLVGYGEPVKARASARARPIAAEAATHEMPVPGAGGRRGLWLGLGVGAALAIAGVAAVLALRGGPTESVRAGADGPATAAGDTSAGNGAGAPSTGVGPRGQGAMAAGGSDAGGGSTAPNVATGASGGAAGAPDAPDAGAVAVADSGASAAPTVEIRVETRPPGALISVDGRGTVCDESPCTFSVPAEERIVVRARKGRASAARELRAMEATTLELALATGRGGGGGGGGGGGAGGGGGGGGGGELKIPDIFRTP